MCGLSGEILLLKHFSAFNQNEPPCFPRYRLQLDLDRYPAAIMPRISKISLVALIASDIRQKVLIFTGLYILQKIIGNTSRIDNRDLKNFGVFQEFAITVKPG